MNMSERTMSAKILQFPQRRRGNSDAIDAGRRPDHVRNEPAKAIHWDAWYHQAAIAEERGTKA